MLSNILKRFKNNFNSKYKLEYEKYQKEVIREVQGIFRLKLEENELETINKTIRNLPLEMQTKLATQALTTGLVVIRNMTFATNDTSERAQLRDRVNRIIINRIADDIHNLGEAIKTKDHIKLTWELPYFVITCKQIEKEKDKLLHLYRTIEDNQLFPSILLMIQQYLDEIKAARKQLNTNFV